MLSTAEVGKVKEISCIRTRKEIKNKRMYLVCFDFFKDNEMHVLFRSMPITIPLRFTIMTIIQ